MGEERALVKIPRERRQAGRRGEWAQRGLEQERQAEQAGRIAAGASAGPERKEGHKQVAGQGDDRRAGAPAAEREEEERPEAEEPATRRRLATGAQSVQRLPAS